MKSRREIKMSTDRYLTACDANDKILTLGLLGDGHAKPFYVHAVLAADAGRATAERMEGDGAHYKRKLKRKLRRPRNVHAHLMKDDEKVRLKNREMLTYEMLTTSQLTHPEHVFNFDDATLQDGGADRGDFDGSTVPRLPAASADYVTA